MTFRLQDFDYQLPPHLIAQQPADRREGSRLLHLNRKTQLIENKKFTDLPNLLQPGDLLVLNDTKVIPARFFCRRQSGAAVEGLYIKPALEIEDQHPHGWEVLLKNAKRCKVGEEIFFEDRPEQKLLLINRLGAGRWIVQPNPTGEAAEILEQIGTTPLPPYIHREDGNQPADPQRYQTVYADRPGAVAAPTAGLHFTDKILQALSEKGITKTTVTLHVGLGTFSPVKHDDLTQHPMHSEWYDMTAETADEITAAKTQGRRVVAVGTTSVRVCESVAQTHHGQLQADSGWTQLFLYPPAKFEVIDALLTNFHLPQSTLLMLVAAFCDPGGTAGLETIKAAYATAIEEQYRFFSYGDAMLIE